MSKHPELGEGVGPRADIVKGMARAMFVDWWANEEERKREDDRNYKLPWGAGDDIMDFAPKTSRNAMRKAGELATTIERLNKEDLPALFDKAQAEGFEDDPEKFGHYLAMQALGHGVAWDDDLRTDVEFKLPHIEYYESVDEARLDEMDPVLAIGAIGTLAVGGAIGAAAVKAWRTIKDFIAVGKTSAAEKTFDALSKRDKAVLRMAAKKGASKRAMSEATLQTGNDDVPEIGFVRGNYYLKSKSGAKHFPAEKGTREQRRERFREKLRNEFNVSNASALIAKLDAMDEGLDEYTGEWPSMLPIPSDSLTPGEDTVIAWPVQTRPLKPGESHDPTVEKDAGWMLRNYDKIRSFTVEKARGDNPNIDCVVIAYTSTGATVAMAFESKALARAFLERPAFDGKRVSWFGSEQVIGESAEWNYQTTMLRIDEMAKLSARGRTELLRMSREREVPGDDLISWERVTEAYMSDGRILKKRDVKFLPDSFRPEGRKHTWGWKDEGRMKPDLMKNPAALRAALQKLRDARKEKGWSIEADTTNELPQSPLTGGGMGEAAGDSNAYAALLVNSKQPRYVVHAIVTDRAEADKALARIKSGGDDGILVRVKCPGAPATLREYKGRSDADLQKLFKRIGATPQGTAEWMPGESIVGKDEGIDEGRTSTPPYVYEMFNAAGAPLSTFAMAWRVSGRGANNPGMGKPNAANLQKAIDGYNESLKPGGANDHIPEMLPGRDHVAAGAIVRRNEGAQSEIIAKVGKVPSRYNVSEDIIVEADEEEMLKQAFRDWLGGLAHLDSTGKHYRIREHRKTVGGPSPKSKPAPWGKLVKERYPDVQDFHKAAHEYARSVRGAKGYAESEIDEAEKTVKVWPESHRDFQDRQDEYNKAKTARSQAARANTSRRVRGQITAQIPELPPKPLFPFAFDKDGDYIGLVLGGESEVPTGAKVRWMHRADESVFEASNGMLVEVSPPGFKGTVKAMKKHGDIDNPYALAWWMKGRGAKSTYKADGTKKKGMAEAAGVPSPRAVLTFIVDERPTPFELRQKFDVSVETARAALQVHAESSGPGGKGEAWAIRKLAKVLTKATNEAALPDNVSSLLRDALKRVPEDSAAYRDTAAVLKSGDADEAERVIRAYYATPSGSETQAGWKLDRAFGRRALGVLNAMQEEIAAGPIDQATLLSYAVEGRQDQRKTRWMGAFMEALEQIAPAIARNSSKWINDATFHYNQGTDPKAAAEKVAKLGEGVATDEDVLLVLAPFIQPVRELDEAATGVEAVEVMRISTRPKPPKEPVMSPLVAQPYDSSQYATYCVYSDGTVVRDQYREGRQTRTIVAEVQPENIAGVADALRAIVTSYAGKDTIADVLFTVSESLNEEDWLGDWKTESDMQVARTIIDQLGGNKFRVMTGAKDFVGSDKGVTFSIGRNAKGVNRVRITLEASDTYTVEFLSVRAGNVKVKSKAEDVYADALQDVFTRHTELYTSLGTMGRKPTNEADGVEGIAYLTGDDAAEALEQIGSPNRANIALWLRKNLARLEREGGWQEGGEFEDDYESRAHTVTVSGKTYTVRIGDDFVVVMRGELEEAATDTVSAVRKVLMQNPDKAFSLKQLAMAVSGDESEVLRAASRLVNQGTASYSRGEGYSLAGNPGTLKLSPSKPSGARVSDQRTYDYTHSDASKAAKRKQRMGLGEATGFAVVRGEKGDLEYWTGKSWTADKSEAKFFDSKDESDAEAERLEGEADETTTSGAVGGFRSVPLGKKPKTPLNIGSVPDVEADVDDEEEDESIDESAIRTGDRVVYGPDPAAKGFKRRDDQIGEVVMIYNNGGVQMAKVELPSGKTLNYPLDEFTKVSDKPKDTGAKCAKCGEPWPCSDSKRRDIRPELRAQHHVAKSKDESMGVGDTSIEVVKRKGKWYVVPPDGTPEAEHPDRESAVNAAQGLARRENYTVVVTIGESKRADEALDEKLIDFQLDIEWQNGSYYVTFPELRGPVGSGYQDEYPFETLDAALAFARGEAARQNFIVVVWNLKPGDTYGAADSSATESVTVEEGQLEGFTLAAQAAGVPSGTPVNYEQGRFTVTLPKPQAARVRELLGVC